MHFMLQKEVVERIVAAAGSKQYGRLGVMLAPRLRATRLLEVGPGAFRPHPGSGRPWSGSRSGLNVAGLGRGTALSARW